MRVAILEDDPDQSELVSLWLQDAGHAVSCYEDAAGFLRSVRRESFDLYVLDWVLPDLSGVEVLSRLRSEMEDFTPAVIATAKNEEHSVVRGLESGADDYLIKPIRRAELVARVGAVMRRVSGNRSYDDNIDASPYEINNATKTISLRNDDISLTNREFSLAIFLFRNNGRMLSRSHILESIWGIDNDAVSTRTVDTHMSRLRKKLKLGKENGWALSAIYQHGYRMEKTDTQENTEQ